MKTQSWLISWIGKTDHECAEEKHGQDIGPIATALDADTRLVDIVLGLSIAKKFVGN